MVWIFSGVHLYGCNWQTSKAIMEYLYKILNTLRLWQDCRHFANDIFKCIFLKGNVRISLKISVKLVPKVQINNIPALVQIMAWRRPGYKSLYGPMLIGLLTHICANRPQWVIGIFIPRLRWEWRHSWLRRGLWWDFRVTVDATLTENRGINFYSIRLPQRTQNIYKSGCVRAGNRLKIALNKPLWRAWHQTIVRAACLVTPLWCQTDARVTRYWQYVSMKNWQNNCIFCTI